MQESILVAQDSWPTSAFRQPFDPLTHQAIPPNRALFYLHGVGKTPSSAKSTQNVQSHTTKACM